MISLYYLYELEDEQIKIKPAWGVSGVKKPMGGPGYASAVSGVQAAPPPSVQKAKDAAIKPDSENQRMATILQRRGKKNPAAMPVDQQTVQ